MIPRFVRKLMRGAGAAALVLVASVVLAPSQAQASCGDYVMIGGQHGQSGHATAIHHEMPGSNQPSSPGCHGPSCSNRSFPPAAPAPRLEVVVEQWAIPGGSALCESPQSRSLIAELRDLPCDGIGLSILRPPR